MPVKTLRSFGVALGMGAVTALSQTPSLPRLAIRDVVYEGAFRIPAAKFGVSEMNYSWGPAAYNRKNHSLFLVGHSSQQAIAEFRIPKLTKSTVVADLAMAEAPIQPFVEVLDNATGGNPQGMNRIGGMYVFEGPAGPRLLVNAFEYYDGDADNTVSSLLIRDAGNLAGSKPEGYFTFAGEAGHVSGWVSPIPEAWQTAFGGEFLVGQSSGMPIIGRWPVGPTAFSFSGDAFTGSGPVASVVPTRRLLDFSMDNQLHQDLDNDSRTNDLWTHLSRVVFGMVVPGTRTYLTVGYSGGHRSGVCYKCVQNDSTLCGGYCAPDAADYDQYYWLWDAEEMAKAAAGSLAAHALRPYAYGPFSTPFNAEKEIGGGAWDAANGLLYLTIQRGDRGQGQFNNPPVIAAFRFAGASGSIRGGEWRRQGYRLSREGSGYHLTVSAGQAVEARLLDSRGRELKTLHRGRVEAGEPLALDVPSRGASGAVRVLVIRGESFAMSRLIAP